MGDGAPAGGDEVAGARSPWVDAGVADQEFPPGLYVVATPLGNAADVTLRALWVLGLVDCIAAEDTRTTAPLLARFGIRKPLIALHQHNEAQACVPLLERLARKERVALVSDAGTPAISDPGAVLVRAALQAGARVIPVPGPSSLTAALSVAGLRTGDIRFLGFVSGRAQARKRQWSELAAASGASVLFEAPHRIAATAHELAAALEPARRVVIARELTKKFESIVQTTAAQLPAAVANMPERGEYVLIIDGMTAVLAEDAAPARIDAPTARWLAALAPELPASRSAAIAAQATGLPRELLYGFLSRGAAGADESSDATPDTAADRGTADPDAPRTRRKSR